MRTYITAILTLMLLVLTACGSNSDESENVDEPENNNIEEPENEPDDTVNNTSNNDMNNEETEGNEDNNETNDPDEEPEAIEPTYEVNLEPERKWYIEPIDDADEEVVLITIDDAPDKYALEMAQTLKDLDVNAIFFVNGHLLESEEKKEVLKEIYDMGFMIGNHTYSHSSLQDLSEEEQKEEIISVNDMVEEIIGERPLFFRAPFGENTDYSKQIADEEGMILMNWSYGYDWEADYQTQEAITDIMVNTELLGNGANMLMHDREWTNAALHDIVKGLQDKGYEMLDPKLIKTKASE